MRLKNAPIQSKLELKEESKATDSKKKRFIQLQIGTGSSDSNEENNDSSDVQMELPQRSNVKQVRRPNLSLAVDPEPEDLHEKTSSSGSMTRIERRPETTTG